MNQKLLSGLCIVLVAGAITACNPKSDEPTAVMTNAIITHEMAGAAITIKPGDSFQVKLESVPTAGYMWLVKSKPDFLEEQEGVDMLATDPENQLQPGFTGGNHYVVRTYKATGIGKGQLELIEAREWEVFDEAGNLTNPAAIEDTFKLTIEAVE